MSAIDADDVAGWIMAIPYPNHAVVKAQVQILINSYEHLVGDMQKQLAAAVRLENMACEDIAKSWADRFAEAQIPPSTIGTNVDREHGASCVAVSIAERRKPGYS